MPVELISFVINSTRKFVMHGMVRCPLDWDRRFVLCVLSTKDSTGNWGLKRKVQPASTGFALLHLMGLLLVCKNEDDDEMKM
jgi:hypothetical protein